MHAFPIHPERKQARICGLQISTEAKRVPTRNIPASGQAQITSTAAKHPNQG